MIIYLISIVSACNLYQKSLSIYPTIGETYIMPLSNLFGGYYLNFSCIDCPENVTISNSFNPIYQSTSSYTTQSLNSNGTHFVTFTKQLTINLYYYENNEMVLQCPIKIDSHLECFNSVFTLQNILIDCYNSKLKILQFYYLKNCEFILFQTFTISLVPQSTKMQIFKGEYLLYAQFYKQYSLLTLFIYNQNSLTNQTTWTQGLVDFDISYRFLYIINTGLLYQLSINHQNQLIVSCTFNNSYLGQEVRQIKVQNQIFVYSDYDMILIVQYLGQYIFARFGAYNGSIVLFNLADDLLLGSKYFSTVQILFSNQFFFVQLNNNITLRQIGLLQFDYQYSLISNYQFIKYSYLNSFTNYLYQFSDIIEIYQLKTPQLEVKFYYQIPLKSFYIEGYSSTEKVWNNSCYLKISPIILNQNDSNITVVYETPQKVYNIFQNTISYHPILGFSGPLMKIKIQMSNESLGKFTDVTFSKQNLSFSQTFSMTNFCYLTKNGSQIFFAGGINGNIFFYYCQTQCSLLYQDIGLENINQIQLIFFNASTVIVGINQGQGDIKIYNFSVAFSISLSFVEFKASHIFVLPAYKQFFLTYENIITLLQDQSIMIQSLTQSDQFTLDSKEISNLFQNYDPKSINFKPINMAMNVVDLSSILYINNQDSVIIIVVLNTYEIIPYGIFNVQFQIYQLNIIIYQLILSYICQIQICFEVWNIMNLGKPYFVKSLPSLFMQTGRQIVSDNLFLYVQSQANSIYVLNPALSYHSSLYYQFNFTANQLSCLAIKDYSLIFIENQFYNLSVFLIQQFQPMINGESKNYIYQTLFTVNAANDYSQLSSPNYLLSVINTQTSIYFSNNLTINSTQHIQQVINLNPESNLYSSGQIISFSFTQNQKKNFCSLQNYIQQNNQNFSQVQKFEIYPQWILMINTTLLMQAQFQEISTFFFKQSNFSDFEPIFQGQINYQNCSNPLVYSVPDSNISEISQMCIFLGSWYLTIYQYDQQNQTMIVTQQVVVQNSYQNIYKLNSINNNSIFFYLAKFPSNQPAELIYVTNNINNQTLSTNNHQLIKCTFSSAVVDYTLIELKDISNYYLIIYICQQELFYFVGLLDSEQEFQQADIDHQLFETNKYISLGQANLLEIQLLYQSKNQLILLLTTNIAPCFIFQASYFYEERDRFRFQLVFDQIIQTIPPYGFYQLAQSTQIINGLIFFVYFSDYDKVYAIYDLTSVHKNISNPIIMKGGINLSLPLPTSLAFNLTSTQEGGQFYDLINGTINNYQVLKNAFLNCTIHSSQDYIVELLGYNSFDSDTLTITFRITKYTWYIGLLTFLAIVFVIASILFWYKTKHIQNENDLFEELELE